MGGDDAEGRGVRSVVADVEALGWRRVTLVGHSLAGLILPQVTARQGGMVHHVVFVACAVPAEGRSVLDTIPGPIRTYARWRMRNGSLLSSRRGTSAVRSQTSAPEVVTFDGPHDAFATHPGPLATILNRYAP